jgi:hypothetical protein
MRHEEQFAAKPSTTTSSSYRASESGTQLVPTRREETRIMATKRTEQEQQRETETAPKPKKKGEQSVTEAARADIPDEGEQPVAGEIDETSKKGPKGSAER